MDSDHLALTCFDLMAFLSRVSRASRVSVVMVDLSVLAKGLWIMGIKVGTACGGFTGLNELHEFQPVKGFESLN